MITYLNNILIYSARTLNDYINKIYKIFRRFNKRNLKFKLEKCRFHQKKIRFLKYIIGRDKIYINPQKIILIKE